MANQVTHREAFRKQEEAGQVHTVTEKRHGLGKRSTQAVPVRPKKTLPPRGVPGGQTLAEMLNIENTAPEAKTTAAPLAPLAPPVTANVRGEGSNAVIVDPIVAEGELPPVAELKQEEATPRMLPPIPVDWSADMAIDPADGSDESVTTEILVEADKPTEGESNPLL